jgi:hypothetical protein
LTHLGDEPVSASGHGDDVTVFVGLLTQALSQKRDVSRQAAFFDNGVSPHTAQQLPFGDHVASMLDESNQGVQHLGRKRHGVAMSKQQPFARVQNERAEFV